MNADDQRKYGLRLNDVVTIVEGSLARQQTEMKRLQDAAVTLRLECDAARVSENQTKSLYEAALSRLNLLQAQNEQLRSMIMTLLNVIEGRESPSALQAVVQRLESTVHETQSPNQTATAAAAEPVPAAAAAGEEPGVPEESLDDAAESAAPEDVDAVGENAEAETAALGDHEELEELAEEGEQAPDTSATEAAAEFVETAEAASAEEVVAEAHDEAALNSVASFDDTAGREASSEGDTSAEMIDAVDEDLEAESGDIAVAAEDMPEDLEEISMNGHRDFVTDADEIVANETVADVATAPAAAVETKPHAETQQDEILVSALLDAEKALIEAGASGVANANSPVAEIIRRISLRTREFSEASGV